MKKFVIILGIIIILIVSTIFIINVTKFNNKNEVQMNVVNNVIPKENIQKEDNKNQIRQNYNNKEVGVKISNTNTWNDGISNYEQYNIELQNNYNSTLKNWSIELPIPLGASILQLWNANYKIDNNNLIISSEIYNNEIEANRNVELGFIAKTNNKFNTTNFKVIIDGEIVNNITENNSSKITTAMDNEIHKKSVISDYVTDNIYENILKRIIKEGALNMQINQTPVEKYGKLSVNGTSLVDSKGKKVQLRGVSTHSIQAYSQYINKETFKEMRDDWGINVIRISMYSNPNEGYSTSLHKKVKEAVQYASELGIYAIIDWHILKDNNPNMHKQEAISFFKEMATEFKYNENVLYEICNEPSGKVTWTKDIKPYAEEVITEIRKIDSDSVIIVGTPNWSQDVDIVADSPIKNQTNIMYTLHFYSGTHKKALRDKLSVAIQKGLPIFVTEFGISKADGNGSLDQAEGDTWISLLNENNISWVCWNLSNKDESSAILNNICTKIYNFEESDFSAQGKWLIKKLKE